MKFACILMGALLLAACSQPRGEIATFEQCVLAGYPVMESYPRRCAVPNGPSFTESLPPVVPELTVYTGALVDVAAVDEHGYTFFRFMGDAGIEHAVLEPEAEFVSDLRTIASGANLSVRGWRDLDGVIHVVTVEIVEER